MLAALLPLGAVPPAAQAAEKSPVSGLIEQAAVSARVDPEVSKRQAESALELLRRDPNPDLEIRAHLLLCDYYSERDQAAAQAQIAAATALLPQATRPGLRAGVLNCQGETLQTVGENDQARVLYDQAAAIATQTGDDQMLAEVLFSSGYLRALRGEYATGLNELRRAQTLFEQQQMPQHALAALDSIAITYNRMGDYTEAAHLFEHALEAQHKAGLKRDEMVTLHNLGRAQENLHEWDAARSAFAASLELSKQLDYIRGQAYALRGLASVANAQGNPNSAMTLLDRASELQQRTPDVRLLAQIELARGIALHQLRRLKESAAVLGQALLVFRQADSLGELTPTYDELAAVDADLGDWRDAFEYRTLAQSTATRLLRDQLDQRFATLKVEFDTAAKEQENELLTRENEANQKALAQQQRAGNLRTAVVILTAMLFALLVWLAVHQRRSTLRLRALAMTDELTGVPNRRAVLALLAQLLRRSHTPTSILIMDIDHFKSINDRHGHLIGDETLRAMTANLREAVAEPALFGRLGGEEFAAVLPATGLEQAITIAERLRERVMRIDLSRWLGDRRITVSIGVATSVPTRDTISVMLRRADAALYAAKDAGRNCVRTHAAAGEQITPRVA
ncbi:MAG TPA: tetratricopeptide repeat-containing diguanylate cyclase [Steroidobacteraceae bacterium]|nr:tetratricopeptide repeat-containing diguanylate cyclase [Steroidobacteraceae bacterium]